MQNDSLPIARIRFHSASVNPPKPFGFDVVVDGKCIAVIDIEEFERAAADFADAVRNISSDCDPGIGKIKLSGGIWPPTEIKLGDGE